MKLTLLLLVVLLVACGGKGESSPILHFDGYDISERDAQLETRRALAGAGVFAVTTCKQFDDMSLSEAVAYLDKRPTPAPNASPTPLPKAATPKPGQKAEGKSTERAVAILLAECKRISP